MAIKIGNNNKIENSNIVDGANNKVDNDNINTITHTNEKKSFFTKHVLIGGIIASLIASAIWFVIAQIFNF